MSTSLRIGTFVLLAAIGTTVYLNSRNGESAPAQAPSPPIASPLSDIAERAVRSVVNISSVKVIRYREFSPFGNDPFFRQFFGDEFFGPNSVPRERRESSLGSGVVVSTEGYILTNNHVVADADLVSVKFPDGTDLKAKIVGTDPKTDIALLQVEKAKNLTAIPLGDSDRLRLAETVLAIGSPFGLTQTVTMGIVSATGRANVGIADYEDFIQTDAAINPGNSGGALVNTKGELVGVNTAIFSRSGGYQGVGFAVPINMAKFVMNELLAHGRVERGYLGIGFQDVTEEIAKAVGLGQSSGAIITGVLQASPADRAGITQGDVILEFNEKSVKDAAHLRNLLSEGRPGKAISVVLFREKKHLTISVTMAKEPEPRRRR